MSIFLAILFLHLSHVLHLSIFDFRPFRVHSRVDNAGSNGGVSGGESEIEMESLTKEDRVFDLSRDNREITRGGKEGEERAI